MNSKHHHGRWPTAVEHASRFDLLLAAIPLLLAVGLGGGYLLSVPLFVGGMGGAVPAAGLVAYSVYAVTQVDDEYLSGCRSQKTGDD